MEKIIANPKQLAQFENHPAKNILISLNLHSMNTC